MTPERIAEIRALDAARTPGQWVTEGGNYSFAMRQLGTTGYSGIIWDYECNPSQDDAAFITATSTAIPELLDALEAAQAEVVLLRRMLRESPAAVKRFISDMAASATDGPGT